ncbi:MAG: hypothetical protein ABSH14_07300 [Verrucomicrobiia bacterium]|jgi:hypothetical protein
MSVRFVDVGPWSIAVESDLPEVHDGLSLNFKRRYSENGPKPSQTLLTCRVVSDANAYQSAAKAVVFSGPEIEVSQGVTIRYGFHPPKTWLCVTETAIIELDASKPTECRVLLHPNVPSSYAEGERPGVGKCVACPEAFFYPMLVEWIRSFDACLVHCGAVAVNGHAVFLNGPPGSGKSTHVLRMLMRGASFVADDLAFLHSGAGGLRLLRFREVANVNARTLEVFPELSHLRDAPVRGDGKYCISIPERFPQTAITDAGPGVILRLHPGETPTIKRVPPEQMLDHMHSMAWFSSRPVANQAHFGILCDWLFQCSQWYVSRAYMRDCLDELMLRLGCSGAFRGEA